MIEVSFKDVKKYNTIIKLDEDFKLHYYRKEIPLFVVRWWLDENTSIEREFKTLKNAKRYSKRLSECDINCYKDILSRYWYKQLHMVDGELSEEYEQ